MKAFLLFFFLIISYCQLAGQGLVLDEKSYMNIPKAPEQNIGARDVEDMPFQKDLSVVAPIPPNQGEYMSCVAMATAINAYSIQRAIEKGFQGTPQEINKRFALSAWFPYKSLSPNCADGTKIDMVAKFIQANGNLFLEEFQVSNKCDIKISDEVKSKAHKKQFIKAIQRVFDVGANADKKISSIRLRISQNIPVILGMRIRDNLKTHTQLEDYYDPKKGTVSGDHAVVVVGYDDMKGAFKIMNSWGPEWGHGGFFWIKYYDLAEESREAITLVLHDDDETVNYQFGGTFGFQVLTQSPQGLTKEIVKPFHSQNGIYKLQKRDWRVNQYFQLIAKNERKGEYFTVFSVNEKNKVSIHYPKDEYSSDVFPIAKFETIIPSTTSALNIKEVGKDYLCILYSQNSLREDIKSIKEKIENSNNEYVPERIREALGRRLLTSGVNYEANEMKFSVNNISEGDIIPIILEVVSVDN